MKLIKGTKEKLFILVALFTGLILQAGQQPRSTTTYYQQVFSNLQLQAGLLQFLTHVFPVLPEQKLFTLIKDTAAFTHNDMHMYLELRTKIPSLEKQPLSETLSEENLRKQVITQTNNYLTYQVKKIIIGSLVSSTQPLELQPFVDHSLDLHKDTDQATRKVTSRFAHYIPQGIKTFYAWYQILQAQKQEMIRQTKEFVGLKHITGYLEIGTPGRYITLLKKELGIEGPFFAMPLEETFFDSIERGSLFPVATILPLTYEPLPTAIPTASLDLVTCYTGLHHIPQEKIPSFLTSLARVLRPGGLLIVREHNATEHLIPLLHVVHSVLNAVNEVSPDKEKSEVRNFQPIDTWIDMITAHGFVAYPLHLTQGNDPTDNRLLCFKKVMGA